MTSMLFVKKLNLEKIKKRPEYEYGGVVLDRGLSA